MIISQHLLYIATRYILLIISNFKRDQDSEKLVKGRIHTSGSVSDQSETNTVSRHTHCLHREVERTKEKDTSNNNNMAAGDCGSDAEDLGLWVDDYDSDDGFAISGPSSLRYCGQVGLSAQNQVKSDESLSLSGPSQQPVINYGEVKKSNPDVSENWLKSSLERPKLADDPTVLKRLLEMLENLWGGEKPEKVEFSKRLQNYFSKAINPFTMALFLIESCKDFSAGKTTTVSYGIIKEFEKWIWGHARRSELFKKLDNDTRKHAFHVATKIHTNYFDMFVKAFNLSHPGNEYCLPRVKDFLEKNKYKEAAQCAGRLRLQHHFSRDQIILPLILQDKINLVESYVYGQPDQQLALVKLLDHLCDKDTDLTQIIRSKKDSVPAIRTDKLQRKILSKLAVRLMKLYGIPPESCPNVSNARCLGALRYLLYKKYIEGSMGSDNWDELIESSVGGNAWLQEQLVDQLFGYSEIPEAVKWARYYRLSDDKVAPDVAEARRTMEELPAPLANNDTEDWGDECYTEDHVKSFYHNLYLPASSIQIIDTREKLNICLLDLSTTGGVIGVDSEWRPAFGTQTSNVALIQMAVRGQVYLVDVLSLQNCVQDSDWEKFLRLTFCNPAVIKLGYGLDADMHMLLKTFPQLKSTLADATRLVDLGKLATKVFVDVEDDTSQSSEGAGTVMLTGDDNEDDETAENNIVDDMRENTIAEKQAALKSEERGLSELVRRCLGKPLSKSEQMSDWQRRPLRPGQMIYAALDAYVLLEVYDVLVAEAGRIKRPVDLEPPVSMKWLGRSKKDKLKAKIRGENTKREARVDKGSRRALNGPARTSVMSPRELSVVVDSMLQGLGKQLRSFGVDTHILENHQDHEEAIKICLRDRRIVLTTGGPFEKVRAHVGEHNCFCVSHDVRAREQAKEVLRHFNVTVTEEDIFSRCCVCNGDYYIQVPTREMKQLWLRKLELLSKIPVGSAVCPSPFNVPIDFETVTLKGSGASVQMEAVHEPMFDKVDFFFLCGNCGKVFWEGTHFERMCANFSDVLTINPQGRTVYKM